MSPSSFSLDEDTRILEQIRMGEKEALVKLYRMSERLVAAFVMRNSGTPDDASDVLQEAVVALWERVVKGNYVHTAKLSTFVLAMAKNMWFRRLARARREVASDPQDDLIPCDDETALDSLVEAEEAGIISAALTRLGDPCRTLLLLYYWEELPMDQIARRMGFANADTVKAKKYQCKKALEKLLPGLG